MTPRPTPTEPHKPTGRPTAAEVIGRALWGDDGWSAGIAGRNAVAALAAAGYRIVHSDEGPRGGDAA